MDEFRIIPYVEDKASPPVGHGKPITIRNNDALQPL